MFLDIGTAQIANVTPGSLWLGNDPKNSTIFGIAVQEDAETHFVNLSPVMRQNDKEILGWLMARSVAANRFVWSAKNKLRFGVQAGAGKHDFVANAPAGALIAAKEGLCLPVFVPDSYGGNEERYVNVETYEVLDLDRNLKGAVFTKWSLFADCFGVWQPVFSI